MSLITSQYIFQRVKEGGVYVSAFKLFVSGKLRIRFSNEGCQYFKKMSDKRSTSTFHISKKYEVHVLNIIEFH